MALHFTENFTVTIAFQLDMCLRTYRHCVVQFGDLIHFERPLQI